jgi:protein-S-isoprenylcysteine O-methyltransferase Ste14
LSLARTVRKIEPDRDRLARSLLRVVDTENAAERPGWKSPRRGKLGAGMESTNVGTAERQRWKVPPAYRLGDYALFALLWLVALANGGDAVSDARAGDWPAALHHLVVAVAVGINALLFLIRGPAVVRGQGMVPKLVAIVGSWMVPPLALLPLTWEAGWMLNATTIAIVAAYAFIVWALLTLRRSFSVFPEARQLIRSGPYRLVRHPLYAAYILCYLAICLPRLSVPALLLAAAGIAGEIWRARFEERLLVEVFPEYSDYAATTPRFVPAFLTPWRRAAPAPLTVGSAEQATPQG